MQEEMLGRVQEGEWAVLVMDPQSTRIMSAACRISEILNYGVARESMLLSCDVNICWPSGPGARSGLSTFS